MTIQLGIDIGGTFTDFILLDPTGRYLHTKEPTTSDDPSTGVLTGIQALLDDHQIPGSAIDRVVHGTTVATNAVLERKGAPTGLITTAGFRDVLQIGRQARPDLYDFWAHQPDPLVPRKHRLTVPEKIGPDGTIRRSLDPEDVVPVIEALREAPIESVAICLLHSYANPTHEEVVESSIREQLPDITVIASSGILPEYREYERMSTTVMNAYVQPLMAEYIDRLETRLSTLGINAPFQIMQSNGGLMTAETASRKSVHTLLSGPSAGVRAGQYVCGLTIDSPVITLDMGGTSTDICMIPAGKPEFSVENEIGGLPVRLRMLDINTIGAGGGSIAWIDPGGALRVGPKSAGSNPGPVCYDRGGMDPTVTDAHLVLGRLNPNHLLGGDLAVDVETTHRRLEDELAEPLGMTVFTIAEGILDVVTSNMIHGIERVSVERGYDPRDCTIVAFGGAGPLHVHRLVTEMDLAGAIVPIIPGVAASLGLLTADTQHDYVRTIARDLDDLTSGQINDIFERLAAEAEERLVAEGIEDASFDRAVDMKYARQGFELTVPVPPSISTDGKYELREAFSGVHEREYGFFFEGDPIEFVNARLRTTAPTQSTLEWTQQNATDLDDATRGTREVLFDGEWRETTIYDRSKLPHGQQLTGPVIVEEFSSTTVIGPGQPMTIDDFGFIHITGDPA